MKSISKLFFIILSSTFILFSACTKTINNEEEEIRAYQWFSNDEDICANLTFNDENAVLTINSYDENCIIKGLCVFSDNNIIIIDNNLESEFVFPYILSGTSLTLEKYGEKIVFYKYTD